MPSLVSVIIPCYNHARFLPRAVASVLAQTYRRTEIVIVDDGSTDDSAKVAKRLIAKNPKAKIILVEQENQGAPRAINAGIAASHGEYLLPLGADDTLEPEMLAETVALMDSDPKLGIVYTYTKHVGDPDEPPEHEFKEHVQEYPDFRLADWIRHNPQLDASSLMRRAAFDETGGFDPEQFAEDLDVWLGIVKRGWRAKLVPKPLFNYWHHGGPRESAESWTRPIDLRWQLVHKHPELYDDRERLFVSSLALAFVLADSVSLVQSLTVEEPTMDWVTATSRLEALEKRFEVVERDCRDTAAPVLSPPLAQAIDRLIDACHKAGLSLSVLTKACAGGNAPEVIDAAAEFVDTLPGVANEMMVVSRIGMPEIYGEDSNNTLLH